MYGRERQSKTKVIRFYYKKHLSFLWEVCSIHTKNSLKFLFKATKAIMGYIQRCPGQNMGKCNACTSQHGRTVIHYQAGHQESFRKLALLEFPVQPSDGSPLFLETEDRPHPENQAAAGPQTPPTQTVLLPIAVVLYSVSTPLQQ